MQVHLGPSVTYCSLEISLSNVDEEFKQVKRWAHWIFLLISKAILFLKLLYVLDG